MAFCGGDWTLALSDYDKPCRLLPMGTMSIAAVLSQDTEAGKCMHYPQVSSLFLASKYHRGSALAELCYVLTPVGDYAG